MRIAARFADEWNTWTTPTEMAHKREVLLGHCEALGRDPAEISISTQAFMFLSDDEQWAARQQTPAPGLPTLRGNTDQVAEVVAAYRDVGVDELIIPNRTVASLQERKDMFDRFIAEIAPGFR